MRVANLFMLAILVLSSAMPSIAGTTPTPVDADAVPPAALMLEGPVPVPEATSLSAYFGMDPELLLLEPAQLAELQNAAQALALYDDYVGLPPAGQGLTETDTAVATLLDAFDITDPLAVASLERAGPADIHIWTHAEMWLEALATQDQLIADLQDMPGGQAAWNDGLHAAAQGTAGPALDAYLDAIRPHGDDIARSLSLLQDSHDLMVQAAGPVPQFALRDGILGRTMAEAGQAGVADLLQHLPADAGPQDYARLLGAMDLSFPVHADLSTAVQALFQAQGVPLLPEHQLAVANLAAELDPDAEAYLALLTSGFAALAAPEVDEPEIQIARVDAKASCNKARTAVMQSIDQDLLAYPSCDTLDQLALVMGIIDSVVGGTPALEPDVNIAGLPLAIPNPNDPNDILFYIGSPGADFVEDPIIYGLDPGGDDFYANTLGGTAVLGDGSSAFIDLGGNDQYNMPSADESLGAGTFRVGMFLDNDGDDIYTTRGDQTLGAGSSFGGLGVFWDEAGNDRYAVQGASTSNSADRIRLGSSTVEGVGLFIERGGDDIYEAKLNLAESAFGNGHEGGLGFFHDAGGDDVYKALNAVTSASTTYSVAAFGSAGAGSSTAARPLPTGIFLDSRGEDQYHSGERIDGFGYGFGIPGYGMFMDIDGTDTYDVHDDARDSVIYGEIGDEQQWAHYTWYAGVPEDSITISLANGPAGGFGIDTDAGLPAVEFADVAARIVSPTSSATVRPGALIDVTVAAINVGDATAEAVTGQLTISGGGPVQVEFGDVAAGATSTQVVPLEMPAEGDYQLSLLLQPGAGYGGELNDLDVTEVRSAPINLATVDGIVATTSGRLAPGAHTTIEVPLSNAGNTDADIDVTLSCQQNGEPAPACTINDPASVLLSAPSATYPTNAPPTTKTAIASFTAPTVKGTYEIVATIPSALHDDCDDSEDGCTLATQTLVVDEIVDAALEPSQEPFADPFYFTGKTAQIRNLGSIPASGSVELITKAPGQLAVKSTHAFTDIPVDGVTTFTFPALPEVAADGESWQYDAQLFVGDDIDPDNNALTQEVLFLVGAMAGNSFDTPGDLVVAPGAEWEHGVPDGYGGLLPRHAELPAANAWVTDLDGDVSDKSIHDLIMEDVDFTQYLDPAILFSHSMDAYKSTSYAYATGYVAAAPEGAPFTPIEPVDGYGCDEPASSYMADPFLGFCGVYDWKMDRVPLTALEGKSGDIRFRYATATSASYEAGWAIDDLIFVGLPRLDGDFQVLDVDYRPAFPLAGEPVHVDVTIRNNGYATKDITIDIIGTVGTKGIVLDQTDTAAAMAGAERRTVSFEFIPPAAKIYNTKVSIPTDGDGRSDNNALSVDIPVYERLWLDDLEGDTSQWAVDGFRTYEVDWEKGTPSVFPETVFSGANAWSTDLDDHYLRVNGGSGTFHRLSAPTLAPVTTPGDELFVTFQHAYDLGGYESSWSARRDIAYVTAGVDGATPQLLHPVIDEYAPGYTSTYYGAPPNNPGRLGFTDTNEGFAPEIMKIGEVPTGKDLDLDFTLFAFDYSSSTSDYTAPGWTVDDVQVLRGPRFDHDLALTGISPTALDYGTTSTVQVLVENFGREDATGATIDVSLALPGQEITLQETLPTIPAGTSHALEIDVDIPLVVGTGRVDATLTYPADEWDLNQVAQQLVDVGRVFFAEDFEQGPGNFTELYSYGLKHGIPGDGAAQGSYAFFREDAVYPFDSYLRGPDVSLVDDSGVIYPVMDLRADVTFGIAAACPYHGFAFQDGTDSRVLPMDGLPIIDVRASTDDMHCTPLDKSPVRADLRPLVLEGTDSFQPSIRFNGYGSSSYYSLPNKGAAIDNVRVIAEPYQTNLAIREFTAPTEGLLGPGEPARVGLTVVSEGLTLPEGLLALHVFSNDGGAEARSLDRLVPLDKLHKLGDTQDVVVEWTPPFYLDGQAVTLRGEVVRLQAGQAVPLVDDAAFDNVLSKTVSVLAEHNLAIDLSSSPNFVPDPADIGPVAVTAVLRNIGSTAENDVDVTVDILDVDGQLVDTLAFTGLTKRPDTGSVPMVLETSWVPPGPGSYEAIASIDYAEDDLDPLDNQARTSFHLGVSPFGLGDDVDSVGTDGLPTSVWTPRGGALTPGFTVTEVDGLTVLKSSRDAYPASAHITWEMPIDLSATSDPIATLHHRYALAPGDVARLMYSPDNGVTWQALTTTTGTTGFTGSSTWSTDTLAIPNDGGSRSVLRFELDAAGIGNEEGWIIDSLEVTDHDRRIETRGFDGRFGPAIAEWDFEDAGENAAWSTGNELEGADDWEIGTPTFPSGLSAVSGDQLAATILDGEYTLPTTTGERDRARWLQSPSISLPESQELWLRWDMFHQLQTYRYTTPGYDHGFVTMISADGSAYEPLPLVAGYPEYQPRIEGSYAALGSNGKFQEFLADLSPYAGQEVQVRFVLDVPYHSSSLSGPAAGVYIDDIAIHEGVPTPAWDNVGIVAAQRSAAWIVNQPASATVTLQNHGTSSETLDVAWSLLGPSQTVIDSGRTSVEVFPGIHDVDVPIGAQSDAGHTLLMLALESLGGGAWADGTAADDIALLPGGVFTEILNEDFDYQGTACGQTFPCLGWTVQRHYGSEDVWSHGSPGFLRTPNQAYSGEYVFGTMLDGSEEYPTTERSVLYAPPVDIDEGEVHLIMALDTNPSSSSSYQDGATFLVNGIPAEPLGGWDDPDCGYYSSYRPCMTGDKPYTPFVIPFNVGDKDLRFGIQSHHYNGGGFGTTIEDVRVLGVPKSDAADLHIQLPLQGGIDPRRVDDQSIQVSNIGGEWSDPTQVNLAILTASGEQVQILKVPALAPGADRSFRIAADRLAEALRVHAYLDGNDANPGNDHALAAPATRFRSAQLDFDNPVTDSFYLVDEIGGDRFMRLGGDFKPPQGELVLPAVVVREGDTLVVDHRRDLGSDRYGYAMFATTSGANELLHPVGGYTDTDYTCYYLIDSRSDRCWGGQGDWQVDTFDLSAFAGQTIDIRLQHESYRYHYDDGNVDVRAMYVESGDRSESVIDDARWKQGPLRNPEGPLEEASQPYVWSTGLNKPSHRADGFDILESPPLDMSRIAEPVLGFDLAGTGELKAKLLVQARDVAGDWKTLETLNGFGKKWHRVETTLPSFDGPGQVRFIHVTDDKTSEDGPGFFLDNLYIGSLRADVEQANNEALTAHDGSSTTIPVRVTNTGPYTNAYALSISGPTPYWTSAPVDPLVLQPGEAGERDIQVTVPFGGGQGEKQIEVRAQSLYDPLQVSAARIGLTLEVTPKPDLTVSGLSFQDAVEVLGKDDTYQLRDAVQDTIIADISNIGLKPPTEPVIVQFYETYGGETRPLRFLELAPGLLAPGLTYSAVLENWVPRRGLDSIEVVVNPNVIGNPDPILPEMNPNNNRLSVFTDVTARPLPELTLAAAPTLSRSPEVGQEISIGIDVRNAGSLASTKPVDVAVLVNDAHAMLTSPTLDLPSNTALELTYSSDLEIGADGVILEGRSVDPNGQGEWIRLAPLSGYTHGCLLAFECTSGLSGKVSDRVITFNTNAFEGQTEFRLRFGMDSNNAATYDGFDVAGIKIRQFADSIASYDFRNTAGGWTADHVWEYQPRDGPLPGRWQIPGSYTNPALVELRTVPAMPSGTVSHVDIPWTPEDGGPAQVKVYIDPKNVEPEFLDDVNLFEYTHHVIQAGFDMEPLACVCLEGADDEVSVDVRVTNTGNTRSSYALAIRDHPFFAEGLSYQSQSISGIELAPGASIDAVLSVTGLDASAGLHEIVIDATDSLTGQVFTFKIPVDVDTDTAPPSFSADSAAVTLVRDATQIVEISNTGNGQLPLLLRMDGKPPSIAVQIEPNDFTLAPFEKRSVLITYGNLGATAGTYTMTLENAAVCEVTCQKIDELTLVVEQYGAPHAAIAQMDTTLQPGIPATFVDGSTAGTQDIVGWRWDFGDGEYGEGASAAHTYAMPGVYQVTLTVTDTQGQATKSAPVLVTVANDGPEIQSAHEIVQDAQGRQVNFTAFGSIDRDGGIKKVTWAFGDGNQATGLNVSHTYAVPGTYRVTVAAEDAYGAVSVDVFEVVIERAAAQGLDGTSADDQESPGVAIMAPVLILALVVLIRRRL